MKISMKKLEIYKIWKSDYKISDFLITQIILKNLKINQNQLFLLDEISDFESIKSDFELYSEGFPIEYILKAANFYSLDFYVDQRVLIPRNDTEIMIKTILDKVSKLDNFSLIDVWTWSGITPITITKNAKNISNIYALDLSKKALEVSKINLENHNLSNKIQLLNSDLLNIFFENKLNLTQNLIISANLPYIKTWDKINMDKEVYTFEPELALYWWEKTGFELYEKLIFQAKTLKQNYNITNLYLYLEIGFDQYEYSKKYLTDLWLKFEYFKDLNNIWRCLQIEI